MARRRPPWHVLEQTHLTADFAFFVSHVSEDAEVVCTLEAAIGQAADQAGKPRLKCFLDVHHWPAANEISEAIKEFLAKCQHMVVWVTPNYLATQRGWVWVELAYAKLLELSLNYPHSAVRSPYIVPIFLGVDIQQVQHTPLLRYWQRHLLHPAVNHPLEKVAERLVEFYWHEAAKRAGS